MFNDANEAILAADERFGRARIVIYEITERDEVEYIGNVDTNHPSFKRID